MTKEPFIFAIGQVISSKRLNKNVDRSGATATSKIKYLRYKRYNVIKNMQRRVLDAINRAAFDFVLFLLFIGIRVHQRRKFSDVVIRNAKEKEGENARANMRELAGALSHPTQKSYARQVFLSEGTSTRQTYRQKSEGFFAVHQRQRRHQ